METWNASTGQNRDTFQRPHRRRTSAPLGPRTEGPAGSLAGLTDPVLLSLIGPWPGMDPTGPLIRQCQVCHSVGREDPHGPEMKSVYLELDSWLFWWRLVRRRIFLDAAYFKLERELGQCHPWAQNGRYRRRRGVHPWSVPDTSPDTSPDPGARIELHYNDRLFPRINKLSRSRCAARTICDLHVGPSFPNSLGSFIFLFSVTRVCHRESAAGFRDSSHCAILQIQ